MSTLPKIALVHDYLREYGGAERVLEALHELYPDAPVYTAFVDRDALGAQWSRFSDWTIIESDMAKVPLIKKLYSPLRLLAAYFFEKFDFGEFDVVISSTNMYMAKAVITSPATTHICYCHTPPRSLYGYSTMSDWKKNPIVRVIGELINMKMRKIDFLTAQRPDVMIANSKETQRRIAKFYRRESVVVYPPVGLGRAEIREQRAEKKTEPYYLYVNRLAYSKHPEIAVEAATTLGVPLHVVGSGSMLESLKDIAGETVIFHQGVSDGELAALYAGASALLYPVADEDFGIVPVEAMMSGVPVIAHNSGGPKETVIDGKTGILFDDLSVDGLTTAIKDFEKKTFSSDVIKKHAGKYSKERFQKEIREFVASALPSHFLKVK